MTNTSSPGNPQADTTVDTIHQLLGNLVQTQYLHKTYKYDAEPWMGIILADEFAVCYMYHRNKGKSTGK